MQVQCSVIGESPIEAQERHHHQRNELSNPGVTQAILLTSWPLPCCIPLGSDRQTFNPGLLSFMAGNQQSVWTFTQLPVLPPSHQQG